MELNFTLEQLDQAAKDFISITRNSRVITLSGPMGAGKTTFIQAVCRQLDVLDKMSSPTYSIINQYKSTAGIIIHHIDLYRLTDVTEAIQAGVEDALNSGDVCFIEWPQIISELLPLHYVNSSLEVINQDTRRLIVNFT